MLLKKLKGIFKNQKDDSNNYRSRINKVSRINELEVMKIPGEEFYRNGIKYCPHNLIEREILFLNSLNSVHFPKVTRRLNDGFCMEYKGELIQQDTIPENWEFQVQLISDILEKNDIIHRDIKLNNILVKDGIIALIDFGWSIFDSEERNITPREMVPAINKRLIYDNRYALNNCFNEKFNVT
jgi:serine/threonine protein kinase